MFTLATRLSSGWECSAGAGEQEHLICYAVKANSALAILKLLADHGAGFDIVSGENWSECWPPRRRLWAGSYSRVREKRRPRSTGADRRNFRIPRRERGGVGVAGSASRKAQAQGALRLRVNPDVFADTHPYISTGLREHKFGVDIRQALKIYKSAASSRWLEPHGVSVHIGSQICTAAPFGAAMERVSKLLRQLQREGIELKTIDAGGGLGIDYHRSSFDAVAKVREYAAAIQGALAGYEGQLLIEPGRFIVAQAGALVTRVLQVKHNGKKTL